MRRRLFIAMLLSGCSAAPCPAWDARGAGLCNLILGFVWDGRTCVAISGCDCVGTDCDQLRGDDDGTACRATACVARTDADPTDAD